MEWFSDFWDHIRDHKGCHSSLFGIIRDAIPLYIYFVKNYYVGTLFCIFVLELISSISNRYLTLQRSQYKMSLVQLNPTFYCCNTCGKFLTNKEHSKLLCTVKRIKTILAPKIVKGIP